MPKYNVMIEAVCNVYVEAKNESEALSRACDEVNYGSFELVTGGPATKLKPAEADTYKRHADVVLK